MKAEEIKGELFWAISEPDHNQRIEKVMDWYSRFVMEFRSTCWLSREVLSQRPESLKHQRRETYLQLTDVLMRAGAGFFEQDVEPTDTERRRDEFRIYFLGDWKK